MILHGESVRTNCALLLCLGRNRNFLRLQYASIHLQSVVVSQTASIYRPNRVRATVGLSLALHSWLKYGDYCWRTNLNWTQRSKTKPFRSIVWSVFNLGVNPWSFHLILQRFNSKSQLTRKLVRALYCTSNRHVVSWHMTTLDWLGNVAHHHAATRTYYKALFSWRIFLKMVL